MQFCIGLDSYFRQYGFNTDKWRKSVDDTKTIVHLEYAKLLISNIENDANIEIYLAPSQELDNIINSVEWTPEKVVG